MNLVQLTDSQGLRRVAAPSGDGSALRLLAGEANVRDLALEAAGNGSTLESVVAGRLGRDSEPYERVIEEGRLLPPIDHPDSAHCLVTGTGLTHAGSARSRDEMHGKLEATEADLSDSMRVFKWGLEGGRPPGGQVGALPEWFYKGDGQCIVPPESPLPIPEYAHDGGDEAELAGVYVISHEGVPLRLGFTMGNEFSDHVLEKQNYLYLAHSKLRCCSLGPELRLGELPAEVTGRVRIIRNGSECWSSSVATGEANMSHTIANLEHHHFKYPMFRRPGDVHIHFFGASGLSFSDGLAVCDGDTIEVSLDGFGRSLRNPIERKELAESVVATKAL